MRLPLVRGTIERRLLVNFAMDPEVAGGLVPAPFSPKLVHGHAVAGICLIRLGHVRPARLPASCGVTSENAAHRIAVTWDEGRSEGVYIPRRDTSSRLNSLAGGRLFPGLQHHAAFEVEESGDRYRVGFTSKDGTTAVSVAGRLANELPAGSIFSSIEEVSDFFKGGPIGYSATDDPHRFEGIELETYSWDVQPLHVDEVRSSFFDDESLFPPGAARFDNAMVMRGIEHEWHALEPLCCAPSARAA